MTLCCGKCISRARVPLPTKDEWKNAARRKKTDGDSQARTRRKREKECDVEDRNGHIGRECHKRSIEMCDCRIHHLAAAHACSEQTSSSSSGTRDCYFKSLATLLYLLYLTCETPSFRRGAFISMNAVQGPYNSLLIRNRYCAIIPGIVGPQGCLSFWS